MDSQACEFSNAFGDPASRKSASRRSGDGSWTERVAARSACAHHPIQRAAIGQARPRDRDKTGARNADRTWQSISGSGRPAGRSAPTSLGADLARLDERSFTAIRDGLRDHLVLRFRGSAIDDRSFIGLARRFGEIEPPEAHTRTAEMTVPGYPGDEHRLEPDRGRRRQGRGGRRRAALAYRSRLHGAAGRAQPAARPRAAGMPAATPASPTCTRPTRELPDGLKRRIAGLKVKHQASHSSTGKPAARLCHIGTDDPRELPGALHPIVRTHPETGRKGLYLGRRFGAYIPPCRSRRARRCWTSCGRMPRGRS